MAVLKDFCNEKVVEVKCGVWNTLVIVNECETIQ